MSRKGRARAKVLLRVSVVAALLLAAREAYFILTTRQSPSPAQLQKAFPGGSHRILENAPQLILLSLDPGELGEFGASLRGKGTFHGYHIIGQTQLSGWAKRKLLLSLYNGMAPIHRDPSGCFLPRHGIRVVQNTARTDLVICFQCQALYTYSGGKEGYARVSRQTQEYFDHTLKSAGVPLSPR